MGDVLGHQSGFDAAIRAEPLNGARRFGIGSPGDTDGGGSGLSAGQADDGEAGECGGVDGIVGRVRSDARSGGHQS